MAVRLLSTTSEEWDEDMEYEELRFTVCEPKAGDGDSRLVAFIEASSTGNDYPTRRAKRMAQVDFPGAHFEVVDEFTEDDRKVTFLNVWASDPAEALAPAPVVELVSL